MDTAKSVERDGSETSELIRSIAGWKRARAEADQIRTWMNSDALQQALDRIQTIREDAPDATDLAMLHAEILFRMGDNDGAKPLFLQGLRANPTQLPARERMALIYSAEGNMNAALEMALWILEEHDDHLGAHRIAAAAFVATDRTALAIPHLRQVAADDVQDGKALNELAAALIDTGRYGQAAALLAPSVDAKTASATTFLQLITCHAKTHDMSALTEILEKGMHQYGISSTRAWISEETFDTVRDDPQFQQWLADVGISIGEDDPTLLASPSSTAFGGNTHARPSEGLLPLGNP